MVWEEICSSTQTLQSHEFGEITMAKNAFAAGDTPYPTRRLDPRANSALATRCLGSPVLCSPQILKLNNGAVSITTVATWQIWNSRSLYFKNITCAYSNGTTFNDLEWLITQNSRARHYSTLNVSETVKDRDSYNFNTKRDSHIPYSRVLFRMTLSDLWWLRKIFSNTKHRAASLRQLSFCALATYR